MYLDMDLRAGVDGWAMVCVAGRIGCAVEGRTHPWTVTKRDGKGLAVRYLDDAPLNGLPKRAWCCHSAMGALYCTHKGPDAYLLARAHGRHAAAAAHTGRLTSARASESSSCHVVHERVEVSLLSSPKCTRSK